MELVVEGVDGSQEKQNGGCMAEGKKKEVKNEKADMERKQKRRE